MTMNIKNDPKFHSALRFYSTLLGIVLAVLILLCCVMVPLETILTQYEAAQPKHLAEEVYKLIFADPDWQVIYNLSGTKATQFEGSQDYVNFMTKKVGNKTAPRRNCCKCKINQTFWLYTGFCCVKTF